ncbi:MAG: helix-turn-helix transcriptional regulator [Sulfuricellaceae bacterium]
MTTIKQLAATLGGHLRNYRTSRNDRQVDFAARIGVGVSTYRAMEAGDARVSLEAWLKAAQLMGRGDEFVGVFEPRGSLIDSLLKEAEVGATVRKRVRKAVQFTIRAGRDDESVGGSEQRLRRANHAGRRRDDESGGGGEPRGSLIDSLLKEAEAGAADGKRVRKAGI